MQTATDCPQKPSGSMQLGVAWYTDNSVNTDKQKKTQFVGGKVANELELDDMSGNVWEWCWDWYGSYGSDPQSDPTGPASGSNRVRRGGAWNTESGYLRSAPVVATVRPPQGTMLLASVSFEVCYLLLLRLLENKKEHSTGPLVKARGCLKPRPPGNLNSSPVFPPNQLERSLFFPRETLESMGGRQG